jgi:hypothetical protein
VRGIGVDALQTATVRADPQVIDGAAVLVPSESDLTAAGAFVRTGAPIDTDVPSGAPAPVDSSSPDRLVPCPD